LKVALDATPLAGTATGTPAGGLARYTSQLITSLAQEFPKDEFILVSDQPFEVPCTRTNLRVGQPPSNILERRWWTLGLERELKRQGAQVFHGVNFEVPVPAITPAVATIHDLSPWVRAGWADPAWRARTARVRKRVSWMIRTGAARHVITPSEAIRREAIRVLNLDPQCVTAIPLAAAPHFCPQAVTPGQPYFLYVGMLEPRKNVEAIISAWSAVRARFDVDLVIVGPERENVPALPQLPGLKKAGIVSENRLAELYSGTVALVYPSFYEGFGLPVLEAMQCGAAVIISSDPALVETAGDAGIQEQSAGGLAQAMAALLENADFRAATRARSLARAAQFSWSRTARATYDVYRSILAA